MKWKNEDIFFQRKKNRTERHCVLLGKIFLSAEKITIGCRRTAIVSTSIGMKLDRKLVGKICSRSSLSARSIEAGAGTVNSGYRDGGGGGYFLFLVWGGGGYICSLV